MGKVLMAGIVPKLTVPSPFPAEPDSYELLETITVSTTYIAPETGYYMIEDFGASGNGGSSAINTSAIRVYGGGGGGSGGYASSVVKLNKDDLVLIVIGAAGSDTTVTINSTTDETYDVMKVTSGANGGNSNGSGYGTGGIGGTASGGNIDNVDGSSGGNGQNVYGHTTPAEYIAYGGSGGTPPKEGCTAGGTGAGRKMYVRYFSDDDQYVVDDYGVIAAGTGKSGFVRISAGNTNVA